jgi:DNA-binding winged helix-turn-helix (wHTH) protein/TolB-like protein
MESASPSGRFAFAQFVFDTRSGDLINGAHCARLSRQPALVLRLLIEGAGEVVSRHDIRQALWSSDTYIDFDQGINWCVRELRKALGDDAAHPCFIETIAKQGYRFLPRCSPAEKVHAISGPRPLLLRSRATAVASFSALLVIVALILLSAHRGAPTLLVLPLDDYTGNTHRGHLADARTDYLISSLGTDPSHLRVIDRPTAYKFKNTGECIIHLGKQLHADYVLVGSIADSGQGARFSGGVFRVADNTQVWTRADADALNDAAMSELPNAIKAALR